MAKYLLNCFLLLLPIIIWNVLFFKKLPEAYVSGDIWDNIPNWLNIAENILRVVVFLLPLLLVLSLETKTQKTGLFIYTIGLLIYFASWLWQMYFPDSNWSSSLIGHMAPAYTPIVIFVGIAMIGQQSFIPFPQVGTIYCILSVAFIIVHSYHAYLAYDNLNV